MVFKRVYYWVHHHINCVWDDITDITKIDVDIIRYCIVGYIWIHHQYGKIGQNPWKPLLFTSKIRWDLWIFMDVHPPENLLIYPSPASPQWLGMQKEKETPKKCSSQLPISAARSLCLWTHGRPTKIHHAGVPHRSSCLLAPKAWVQSSGHLQGFTFQLMQLMQLMHVGISEIWKAQESLLQKEAKGIVSLDFPWRTWKNRLKRGLKPHPCSTRHA